MQLLMKFAKRKKKHLAWSLRVPGVFRRGHRVGLAITVGIPLCAVPTGWPRAVARSPAPTERSVQISRTTLVRRWFTARR